jgi:hypothetical protein
MIGHSQQPLKKSFAHWVMSYEQGLSSLFTGHAHRCSVCYLQHIHQSRMANSSRSLLVDMPSLTPSKWLVLCCANCVPHLFHSEHRCRLSLLKVLLSADLHEVVDYINTIHWLPISNDSAVCQSMRSFISLNILLRVFLYQPKALRLLDQ